MTGTQKLKIELPKLEQSMVNAERKATLIAAALAVSRTFFSTNALMGVTDIT